AWASHEMPPALGPVPDVIDDPAIVMLWGITRESLDAWLKAESGGDTNEIKGFAASSGVVEGTARVVKSVDEIARLRDGDILVCQVTNPTWSPIFSKIAAAVSDIGGSMSHAAIVAREDGLPAVVGTGTATRRIRDGQRIRVAGGRGIVTLLDRDNGDHDAYRLVPGHRPGRSRDGGRQGRIAGRTDAGRHSRAAGFRGAHCRVRGIHR